MGSLSLLAEHTQPEKASDERRQAYTEELEVFAKQIEGKIADLESPKYHVREVASKELEALIYAKKLPEEKRTLILSLLRKSFEANSNNQSKAELTRRLEAAYPTAKWDDLMKGVIAEIKSHPRFSELRDVLDSVTRVFTAEEKEQYFKICEEIRRQHDKRYKAYNLAMKVMYNPEQNDKLEVQLKKIKEYSDKVDKLNKQKHELLVKTLQKHGFKAFEQPPVSLEKPHVVSNADKLNEAMRFTQPIIKIERNSKKYTLESKLSGDLDLVSEAIDEINPIENYQKNAKQYVYLPGDIKAKDLKKFEIKLGLTATFDHPTYTGNFEYENGYSGPDEENGGGWVGGAMPAMANMVRRVGKIEDTREVAFDIFRAQFQKDEKAMQEYRNFTGKQPWSEDLTIIKSENPEMKNLPPEFRTAPFRENIEREYSL
jgi:hypothetical protein